MGLVDQDVVAPKALIAPTLSAGAVYPAAPYGSLAISGGKLVLYTTAWAEV